LGECRILGKNPSLEKEKKKTTVAWRNRKKTTNPRHRRKKDSGSEIHWANGDRQKYKETPRQVAHGKREKGKAAVPRTIITPREQKKSPISYLLLKREHRPQGGQKVEYRACNEEGPGPEN